MPLIYSPSSIFSPSVSSLYSVLDPIPPIIPSRPESIFTPAYGFVSSMTLPKYEDLNYDPEVRKKMIRYFYYKVLGDWLYDDYKGLLNYFVIKNDIVDVISNLNEVDESKQNSIAEQEKKIEFIKNYIFTKKFVYKILSKYIAYTNSNWYDLNRNEYYIKKLIKHKLKNKILKAISEKQSYKKN